MQFNDNNIDGGGGGGGSGGSGSNEKSFYFEINGYTFFRTVFIG